MARNFNEVYMKLLSLLLFISSSLLANELTVYTSRKEHLVKDIFAFTFDDFELLNYDFHPAIKAPIAV